MFKELLKMAGITQRDLANKLGIKQSAVSQWVTGQTAPKRNLWNKLTKILKVPLDDLIKCFEKGGE